MDFTIRASLPSDAAALAPRLRACDKQEVLAAGSVSPEASLRNGYENSVLCLTVVDCDGAPQLMAGVAPSHDPLLGYVWMLSSDYLLTQRKALMKLTPEYLDKFHKLYPLLTNVMDARNKVHERWLRRVGFSFINTIQEYGPQGLPFHTFVRLKHV